MEEITQPTAAVPLLHDLPTLNTARSGGRMLIVLEPVFLYDEQDAIVVAKRDQNQLLPPINRTPEGRV